MNAENNAVNVRRKTPSQIRRWRLYDAIASEYSFGETSIEQIMEAHGVSRSTVYNALAYEGVELRGQHKKLKRGSVRQRLIEALAPFVTAYEKARDEIGDSDLYDEQPRHVTVTLGDCRRASRLLWELSRETEQSMTESEARQIAAKAELRDLGVRP
jgi:AcrR family transcriptional regulator